MSKDKSLRFNLIREYCFTIIDANIILHYLFDEEEFKAKIKHFIENNKKEKIVCEILPKTVNEITKKIYEATNEFSNLLKRCKAQLGIISRRPLSELQIDRTTGNLLENTFSIIFREISRKNCSPKQKLTRMRRARIVESTIMIKFWEKLGNSDVTMNDFFESLKTDFGDTVKQIFTKQALLVKEIGATTVDKKTISQTTQKLQLLFSKSCRINNSCDVELLCQAVSRMYDVNRWAILLTTDYGDIVSKSDRIWRCTLLTVCDPLYFLYKLDNKIDLGLTPKSVAAKYKILFAKFFKSKTPFGVV